MRLFCRCPTPSESCRLALSTQQKFVASPQFLVLGRGEERTLAFSTGSSPGAISFNFSHLLPFAMKRKQKRFLQMTLLFMVALIFLPNIGLWSLYKEKHLVKSTEPGEQQVSATHRKITGKLVRLPATLGWGGVRAPGSRWGIGLDFPPSLSRTDMTRL